MDEKRYTEIGSNYRFFLRWRHAAFAADLVVLWGMASLCISAHKASFPLLGIIPLLASPIGIFLWMADMRTRDIYRAIVEEGKNLEGEAGGPYTKLYEIGIPKDAPLLKRFLSQSWALNGLFWGTSVALAIVGILLLVFPITG